jgi:hypothetical protein
MRNALLYVAAAIIGLAIVPEAKAQSAWCAIYKGGAGTSCGFSTFEQCMASVSGVGGSCNRNPASSGGGSWRSGSDGPARSRARDEDGARQQQRAKAREERAKAREAERERQQQELRARQEQKAKQAEPKKEPPAKPAVAAPATPAAPTPAPAAAIPAAASAGAMPRKAAPKEARVYFVSLKDGAEITSPVAILFGLTNMGVAPAGSDNVNTGHHHLIIDSKLPPLDLPIPNDFNHLHFGAGQSEAMVTLPPGKHTLQLLFADENHVPHDPPLMSAPITVIVKAK